MAKAREEPNKAVLKEYLLFIAVCRKPLKVNSSQIPAKDKAMTIKSKPFGELLMSAINAFSSSITWLAPKTENNMLEIAKSNKKRTPPKATPNKIVLGLISNFI